MELEGETLDLFGDESGDSVDDDATNLTLEEFTERLKLQGKWGINLTRRRQVKDKKRAVARMLDHLYAHFIDFDAAYKDTNDMHHEAILCLLSVVEWLRDTWNELRYQL